MSKNDKNNLTKNSNTIMAYESVPSRSTNELILKNLAIPSKPAIASTPTPPKTTNNNPAPKK